MWFVNRVTSARWQQPASGLQCLWFVQFEDVSQCRFYTLPHVTTYLAWGHIIVRDIYRCTDTQIVTRLCVQTFSVLGCYSECWSHPASQQLNFPVSLMESVCQIKQLLQARTGRQSQSWKPFSLTAKTRLTGKAACVCSRSRTNIVVPPEQGWGGVRVPRPGGSVKSWSDVPLPPRPNPQLFSSENCMWVEY